MSREYVSTEFNCQRISVNELAFDSFVLLVLRTESYSRKEIERVSGKLFPICE